MKKKGISANFKPIAIFFCVIFLSISNIGISQNVGINQLNPDPSAILDITATDMGLLIPRVALDDVNASAPVTAPAEGLLIYNETGTEASGFYFWNGTMWTLLGANGYNTTLNLNGTILELTDNGGMLTADLSSLQDGTGTDDQNILGSGLAGTTLTIGIEGGSSETVDLSTLQDGTGNDWTLIGNAAIASNFIGTTNAIDFRMYTNNTERMTIEANGNVGIGTNIPTEELHVAGSVRIVDGTQAADRIFTSDANGVGTWQEPSVQPVVYDETTTPYGSDNTRKTITITTTSATDKVLLLGEFDFTKDASQSYVSLGIWRGATEIAETSILATADADNTCFVQWVDVPGVGTFTYTIQDRAGAGGYTNLYGSMLTAVVYK